MGTQYNTLERINDWQTKKEANTYEIGKHEI